MNNSNSGHLYGCHNVNGHIVNNDGSVGQYAYHIGFVFLRKKLFLSRLGRGVLAKAEISTITRHPRRSVRPS